MIHWQVTSQQFEAAFFAMQRDRLPYPLWNALRATSDAELAQERRAAIDALMPRVDDHFARLCGALAEPRVRIHLHGRFGEDPANPDVQLRGYVGLVPGQAAVAMQEDDPRPGVSGEITLTLCSHRQAVQLLGDTLPKLPAGLARITGLKSELDTESDWIGNWNRPPTLRDRLNGFLSRPRIGWGEILCYPGPFLDNRTDNLQGFLWMDYPQDGRYFVHEDAIGYTVEPMSSAQFVNHTEALVRRILDQQLRSEKAGSSTRR